MEGGRSKTQVGGESGDWMSGFGEEEGGRWRMEGGVAGERVQAVGRRLEGGRRRFGVGGRRVENEGRREREEGETGGWRLECSVDRGGGWRAEGGGGAGEHEGAGWHALAQRVAPEERPMSVAHPVEGLAIRSHQKRRADGEREPARLGPFVAGGKRGACGRGLRRRMW